MKNNTKMRLTMEPSSLAKPNRSRRKFSIPVSLTPPTLGDLPPPRRRFSNVGDAARKLSSTIGWRTVVGGSPPVEIVAVGRALCILYVRSRLKRAGVFNKKLALTRVRSAVGSLAGCGVLVREIFPGLSCACAELERMHPKLFTKITRQTGPAPGGGAGGLLLAVGHHLLRSEPTWGKVVAIYSVAAGLAVDCVRQGHHDQLHIILEDMTELLEERIAHWININGGWNGLMHHCKPQDQEVAVVEYLTIFALVAAVLLVAFVLIRICIKMGITFIVI